MGSKDSFAGGGGNIGNDLREGIDDWLANLPGSGGVPPTVSPSPQADSTPAESATARLTPRAQRVARTSLLFKTASGTGSQGATRHRRPVPALSGHQRPHRWPRCRGSLRIPDW